MATYSELYNIRENAGYPDWAGRIEFAISVSAEQIAKDPTATQGKLDWSVRALSNPSSVRPAMEQYVLADNRSASIQQILEATDMQIQTNVDEAVAALVPD